ncbi:MED7 protein-domain-containing protein [Phialemonium atrogriseum]|uniref:Mediator of RNA polymerase II transcription subunit 7 n=1 Tax=Phialemonium atrogriseum TaxID=1093897 RepID=A0AAJ0FR43_9PEZI|nr:MED7 protein-domain-containing protein [Phialemonium atrogriseum]KAK1772004.1 MED7 protein-domain-containing protein [Phialemonium atrogriseum]
MAEPINEPSIVSSTFPDPPPFWQDFTPEKIERFESLKSRYANQQGLDAAAVIRVPDVPEDLVNLQPPAEPADRKWRLFGEVQTLDDELQSLETAGIDRLVPASESDQDGKHIDRAFALKRLAKSLLLNFLEWMGVMAIAPEQGSEKVSDLRTLLLNFHHILNEYRPHQAREQLIAMMQSQLDNKRAETAAIRSVVDKAKRVLEGLGSIEVARDGASAADTGGAKEAGRTAADHEGARRGREDAGWEAVDSDFA